MEEAAGNAVLEVGKCLAAPIGRQFMYCYNYKSNFDNLEKEIGKLQDARDEVKDKVVAAENNVKKIKQQVKDWQRNVDSIIDEAEQLVQEKTTGRCFNLITCYKNSRKASKKVEALTKILKEKEAFSEVSLPTTHEDIRLKNKDYEEFESRLSTLNGVLNAVEDAEAGIIGVYGMGGIGKTTLVKEVGQQAKKKQLLDEFVFVEVSDKRDTKKIQDELANQLSLKFEEEAERASKLYARLKTGKKILVILDNIWEELNLKDLGIPCGNDRGGCKVLLTARVLNVLTSMDSVKNFPMGFLTEDEAWSLFKKMAGDVVDQTIIKRDDLPNNVCKECRRLPIVITTVARALRNKGHRPQWEDALRELRMPSPIEFEGLLQKDYSKIALSYNYLKGDELKRTFLVCSLMVNDTTISDLFKYIMGLDILQGVILTIEQARNRLESLVCELKDSCLLLDGRTNEHFSMHDVVRAVAIKIAYRDEHVFTERNMEREWSNKDKLKKCSKISLADTSVISKLWPEGLHCPKLEFFSMWMIRSFKIPEECFVGMGNLKVLSLLNMKVLSLPSSLSLLINLQTLCLNYGNFEDITIIGELRQLKILSLQCCEIKQLTGEIGNLTQLRLLDLSDCWNLEVIAPTVISCLLQLEELYMSGCSILWKVEGLEELKHLTHLTALEIDNSDDKILPNDFLSKKLERYKISIGERFGGKYITDDGMRRMHIESFSYDDQATVRMLKLKFSSEAKIWPEQFQCFKNVEFLCLDKLEGIKNDVYELDKEGFSQLKHLHVHNNPNIVCIVDSTKCIPYDAFPLLESVILFNLINLKKICYGQPTTKSFYNLKVIEVKDCSKLENIFSFSDASRRLPHLQRIRVEDCENMNEIFAVEREDRVNKNEVIEFFQLRFLTLINLPRIASFYSSANTPSTLQTRQVESSINLQSNEIYSEDELVDIVTPIFNKKVIFPSLEALKLGAINSEKIWDNQLPTMSCGYQNLKSLIVYGCQKLKYVFPSSIIKSFEQLQHLEIRHCKELKEIVAKEEGAEATATFIFPRLAFLKLEGLPELTTFYLSKHTSEWQMLKKLEVCNCHRLHIFNSEYKVNSNLEELTLSRVEDLVTLQHQVPENFFGGCTVEIKGDRSTNIPVGILQRLNNLKKLILREGSYKELFTCGEDEKSTETLIQIKSLTLSWLSNVKYLWRNDFKLDAILQNLEVLEVDLCGRMINVLPSPASFENLKVLKVYSCYQLINVVTPSVAKHLVQLREMQIEHCWGMIEIVSNEKDVAVEDKIVFNKLELLSLSRLESLTCFYPGKYTLNFPSLKELIVERCPKMKSFSGGILNTQSSLKVQQKGWGKDKWCWKGDLNTTIQHMYKEKVNSNSESIMLSGEDITSIWQDRFSKHQFSKVKDLHIIKDDSAHFPMEVLEGFNSLEKMMLAFCSYKEIFSCGEDEKCVGMLTQIKQLELCGLFNLKDIWKQDSHMDSIFQNLEMLHVDRCHTLINLVPSSTTFENLTTLWVQCCDGLINLVSSSIAKSLVRLKEMSICHCGLMTEVVSNERDIENDEIVFDKLKSLTLHNLESLTSFCSGNYTFKFPILERLVVKECPNMNTFSGGGVLSTPKSLIFYDHEAYKVHLTGDLNTTIQHLHRKLVGQKFPGSSSNSA